MATKILRVGMTSKKLYNIDHRLKLIAEKKRKRKELDNFYKFQMRDAKLQRIEDLKSKFEGDKEKQLKMKQERKFKPFK
jgi:ribosomal RNA-processing protein 7